MTHTDLGNNVPAWRKAQRSVGNGACVEVASVNGMIAIRDSKNPNGAVLFYTPVEWNAFLNGVRKHKFDDLR